MQALRMHARVLLWLAATPLVAGQSMPADRPAAETQALSPLDFYDDFSQPTLAPERWDDVQGDLRFPPRPGLRLGFDAASAGRILLETVPLDLAATADPLELVLVTRAEQLAPGTALHVEALTPTGEWTVLGRISVVTREVGAQTRVIRLPAETRHNAARVRLRGRLDETDSAWWLERVEIRAARAAEPALTVHSRVGDPLTITLIDEFEVAHALRVPFQWTFGQAPWVDLIAPAESEGSVFRFWSSSDALSLERSRHLRVRAGEDVTTQAHYTRATSGAEPALLHVRSEPEPGIPVSVALEGTAPYAELRGEDAHSVLDGECIELTAPARTERLRFYRWRIGDTPGAPDEPTVTLTVEGDLEAVAQYVVLGDMNGDARLDRADVEVFLLAITNPLDYAERYPMLDPLRRGDITGDGLLDEADIEHFVGLLLNR